MLRVCCFRFARGEAAKRESPLEVLDEPVLCVAPSVECRDLPEPVPLVESTCLHQIISCVELKPRGLSVAGDRFKFIEESQSKTLTPLGHHDEHPRHLPDMTRKEAHPNTTHWSGPQSPEQKHARRIRQIVARGLQQRLPDFLLSGRSTLIAGDPLCQPPVRRFAWTNQ